MLLTGFGTVPSQAGVERRMPRSCPTCGSKRWRKDAVTGSAVCEEGHIFQDFRSENLDLDPLVGYALQKRRMRTGERINKRKVYGRANKEFYHGDEGEYLKLQALQLLLRYQIQALKRLWSLPDIFEGIVRDLWSYQLAISPLPPIPDGIISDAPLTDAPEAGLEEMGEVDEPDAQKEEDESDASLEERYTKEEEDEEAELLRRISEDEAASDEDNEPPESKDFGGDWRRRRKLVIRDTAVTLVLGLWVLRYPVMNVEVERTINDNDIPYLDFCNTSLVPPEMRFHMGKELVLALSPRSAPTTLQIFTQCRNTARILSRKFGVIIPDLNTPPVIWKTISPLGSSPTIYDQIIRLLTLLNVNFSLLNTSLHRVTAKVRSRSSSRLEKLRRSESDSNIDSSTLSSEESDDDAPTRMRTSERPRRYNAVLLPELAIVAAWVILMKMAYGLDGSTRHAITKSEPLVGMADCATYMEDLKDRREQGYFKGSAWGLEKYDFTRMADDDMDAFLSQAEKVLLRDRPETGLDVSLFPLNHSSRGTSRHVPDWTRFHTTTPVVMPLDVPVEIAKRQLPLQPSESLRVYDKSDDTGTLPLDLETVLGAASDVINIKEEEILRIVGVFERKLKRIKRERSKSRSRSRSRTGGDLRRAASSASLR